jgi:hypothetical protein
LRRGIIAFSLSVLSAAFVGLILGNIVAYLFDDADGPISLTTLVGPYPVAAFILLVTTSAAALAIFGIPLTILLSRRGVERGWSYPALGLAIGLVVALVWSARFFSQVNLNSDTSALVGQLMLIGGSSGCAAGFVWWHVYRKRVSLAEGKGA